MPLIANVRNLAPPSAYVLCGTPPNRAARTSRLFEMVNPRKYMTAMSARGKLDAATVGDIWRRIDDDAVADAMMHVTLRPGDWSFGYQPVPAGHPASTSVAERAQIQLLGEAHGCHTCGAPGAAGNAPWGVWIADHQPPKTLKLLRSAATIFDFTGSLVAYQVALDTAAAAAAGITVQLTAMANIRLYPHCGSCSLAQSGLVSRANAHVDNIQSYKRNAAASPAARQNLTDALTALGTVLQDAVARNLFRAAHLALARSTPGTVRAATSAEKQEVQRIGGQTAVNNANGTGCHSCGQLNPKTNATWIGDHQPPTALHSIGLRRDPKQYLYPQCLGCSTTQSAVTNQIARAFAFLKADYEVAEL